MLAAADSPRSRRAAGALLALAVVVAHLWLAERHWPAQLGDGAGERPRRMEVSFMRELAPAAPPVAAAEAPARRLPSSLVSSLAVARAASAPLAAEPIEPPPVVAATPEPAPPLPLPAALPELQAVAPVPMAAAASASADVPFDWPPSTRLSYTISGEFRGPVQGQAQVEWLRQGSRYQVRMDVTVGPNFAPLFARRVSSEGEITPEGLRPRRYDEETRALLRDTRRLTIWLDDDQVRLPGGASLPRAAGVQDSASQFVQMTWLFITRPERLRAGNSMELPLALPRRVEPWIYDVIGSERVATPVGEVDAVHVKPRREGQRGSELTPEIWVAPSLQYLPVRMLIRRDAETWLDLVIERLPQQAAPGR